MAKLICNFMQPFRPENCMNYMILLLFINKYSGFLIKTF